MCVPDREGAIPGQSHMARGGMARWVPEGVPLLVFFLFYLLEEFAMSDCVVISRFPQSGRLHERGNVSVSVRSSEQTEPADAGQRDAGRSLRPTLLNCSAWSFLLSTVSLFFVFLKKFPFLRLFLTDTFYFYFSDVFLSPMCDIVILDIKHRSLYIVCTARLCVRSHVLSLLIQLCSASRCEHTPGLKDLTSLLFIHSHL